MITKGEATALMHAVDDYKAAAIMTVISDDEGFMKRIEKIFGKADVVRTDLARPEYRYFIRKGT